MRVPEALDIRKDLVGLFSDKPFLITSFFLIILSLCYLFLVDFNAEGVGLLRVGLVAFAATGLVSSNLMYIKNLTDIRSDQIKYKFPHLLILLCAIHLLSSGIIILLLYLFNSKYADGSVLSNILSLLLINPILALFGVTYDRTKFWPSWPIRLTVPFIALGLIIYIFYLGIGYFSFMVLSHL
jgi:hypothetical protein